MQQLLAQIYGYLLGVWRFRWLVLFVAWGIALAGWGFIAQMPDKYRASARIHVDTNSVLRPLLQGLAIQPNTDQRVSLMSKTMLTMPNPEKLMRMASLDIKVTTDAQQEAPSAQSTTATDAPLATTEEPAAKRAPRASKKRRGAITLEVSQVEAESAARDAEQQIAVEQQVAVASVPQEEASVAQ